MSIIHDSYGNGVGIDNPLPVQSIQKKWRESFPGTSLDTSRWDIALGSGAPALSVSGGALTFGSGTTTNAVSALVSKETFSVPFRVSIGFSLSQRIANQTFHFEAVSIDPITKQPDDKNIISLQFDGTTATQAKYAVGNNGVTPLVSSASTIVTTASASVIELEPFADEAWFHSSAIDTTSGRTNSYRRHQNIPDPNAIYKLRLRWVNGATPPATNTNAVVLYIACQDYAELTAEITAGRGQSVAGQGVGVNVVTMPTTTVTVSSMPNTTTHTLNSAATTNATNIKSTAGNIYGIVASNINAAARYLKVYNIY